MAETIITDIFSRCGSRGSRQSRDYTPLPTQDDLPGYTSPMSFSPSASWREEGKDRRKQRRLLTDVKKLNTQSQLTELGEELQKKNRSSVAFGSFATIAATLNEDVDAEEEVEEEEQEIVLAENHTSWGRFVEKSWFQAMSAIVIMLNLITTILEMDKPETKDILLVFVSDQVMLAFYVVELVLRAHYFGIFYLCGPLKLVCWNVLDITVVLAGVLDQWLMPVLPVAKGEGELDKVLQMLRLLRLLRVFKIVRVFLDIDLKWTESAAFQSFIGFVILVNSLLMGMEIDVPWHGWFYFEQVLLCIYVFELSVRLKNFGRAFFSCSNADITWNALDFIIVSSSVLDSWITPLCALIMKTLVGASEHKKEKGISLGKVMMLMRMLRLMRILRLAKLVKSVRPLYILVTGVLAALQGVAWVLVLTIVTLYAMGILATSLIGKKMAFPPGTDLPEEVFKPFSTVPDSMFTLFRIMSGAASDTEVTAIDELMENIPSIKLGFVFFMITSSWTLLSILTAVVSDNMISTTGQQEAEINLANAEDDRNEHVENIMAVFNTIDSKGDGQVEQRDIEEFLSDAQNAIITAKCCRVPVRDVREVLRSVTETCDDTVVSLDQFVEYLADVSKPVTEKSMMKMEARFTALTRVQTEGFSKMNSLMTEYEAKEMERIDKAESVCEGRLKDVESLVQGLAERIEACLNEIQQKNERFLHRLGRQVEPINNVVSEHGKKAEAVCPGQGELKEVERLMQGLAERTEACLSEFQQKNQRLFESTTEALEKALPKIGVDKFSEMLELRLNKIQHEFLGNMREQESAGSPEAAPNRETQEEPTAVNENCTDVADIARASGVQMELSGDQLEARSPANEEPNHGLQAAHKAESALRRRESAPKAGTVHVSFEAESLLIKKESLESELRMLR